MDTFSRITLAWAGCIKEYLHSSGLFRVDLNYTKLLTVHTRKSVANFTSL